MNLNKISSFLLIKKKNKRKKRIFFFYYFSIFSHTIKMIKCFLIILQIINVVLVSTPKNYSFQVDTSINSNVSSLGLIQSY